MKHDTDPNDLCSPSENLTYLNNCFFPFSVPNCLPVGYHCSSTLRDCDLLRTVVLEKSQLHLHVSNVNRLHNQSSVVVSGTGPAIRA